jgi:hypothetical protein
MDNICLVLPLRDGGADDARSFMRELEDDRKAEYEASERRIGISKEAWFLAAPKEEPVLVAYMESDDFGRALEAFVQSQDGFDLWFKRRLADSTGLDLNNPPSGMSLPELVSYYSAS